MAAFDINNCLRKIVEEEGDSDFHDKDYRFMALNDLHTQLLKEDFKIDARHQQNLCRAIVKRLSDRSSDVQTVAISCLAPVTLKVQTEQQQRLFEMLASLILTGNDQERDISATGLKTIIMEIKTEAVSSLLIRMLVPRFLDAVKSEAVEGRAKYSALEIMNDILKKHGSTMSTHYEALHGILMDLLRSENVLLRKRALVAVGTLVIFLPERMFQRLLDQLISLVSSPSSESMLVTAIQAVGCISRAAGYRLGRVMDRLMPKLLEYAHRSPFHDDSNEEAIVELRDACLQTIENLCSRCIRFVGPFVEQIISITTSESIRFDPNWNDADDDEDSGCDDDDDDLEGDDDPAWKVRRAAARCLNAIILTRADLLGLLHAQVAPVLVQRFTEREETVKEDVFNAFCSLLRQTNNFGPKNSDGSGVDTAGSPLGVLRTLVPGIVRVFAKVLNTNSIKMRTGALRVLTELCTSMRNALGTELASLRKGLQKALSDSQASIKIEALALLRRLFQSHDAAFIQDLLAVFVPPMCTAASDRYFRLSSDALRTIRESCRVLTAGDSAFVSQIYNCVMGRLQLSDADREVKENAIGAMGQILAHLSGCLPSGAVPSTLSVLLDRLKNEITRLAAVQAFQQLADSSQRVPLTTVLGELVPLLASFLRKNDRQLKHSTLQTITSLVSSQPAAQIAALVDPVLDEAVPLVCDQDLHLADLSLALGVTLLSSAPATAPKVVQKLLPRALALFESPLLQGRTLKSLLAFLGQLEAAGSAPFASLMSGLMSAVKPSLTKQSLSNIAQGIAVICGKESDRHATVERFLGTSDSDLLAFRVALLALGEIGRRFDLGGVAALIPVTSRALEQGNDEIKTAASFALGSVAVGSMARLVPHILNQIGSQPRLQYMLLHSLKEVILRGAGTVLEQFVPQMLELLAQHMDNSEEGVRNIVAECMGKLAMIQPSAVLPMLMRNIGAATAVVRATVVTAFKYMISDHPQLVDAQLDVNGFLVLLSDPDVTVRRAATVAMKTLAHNKPQLIRPHLHELFPRMLVETEFKADLVVVVECGPIKERRDNGLNNRKVAYECMDALLDSCVDCLDITAFMARIKEGLKDVHDIKMLCHLMVPKLVARAGGSLLSSLDPLAENLRENLSVVLSEAAVQADHDRRDDLVRAALRSTAALNRCPDADSCIQFADFLGWVRQGPHKELFEAICNDSNLTSRAIACLGRENSLAQPSDMLGRETSFALAFHV